MKNQINPNQLSEKQMQNLIQMFNTWFYQSEPVIKINNKYSDVISNPDSNEKLYEKLIRIQSDLYYICLYDAGLYKIYCDGLYSIDELSEEQIEEKKRKNLIELELIQ